MGASVVSGVDASPVFEFGEHVFDLVPLFVEGFVVFELNFTVLFGRDARCDSFIDQGVAKPVGVITTIRQQVFGLGQGVKQQGRALVIAHLTF